MSAGLAAWWQSGLVRSGGALVVRPTPDFGLEYIATM
jgi:hypothetical protein